VKAQRTPHLARKVVTASAGSAGKGRLQAGQKARRITGDHRLVYRVGGTASEQRLEIASCRYHY
jgi:hypothetical protein